MRLTNIRVEFYGGPSDGEVIFQRDEPIDHYELVSRNGAVVETHLYELKWESDNYVRYFYSGCK